MKKTLLTLACAALCAGNVQAQVFESFPDVIFYKQSADGKWLVEDNNGVITVYDRKTDNVNVYQDEKGIDLYTPGLGASITNDGLLVGSNNRGPVLMKDGKMTLVDRGDEKPNTSDIVNAITADGKRMCGFLGVNGSTIDGGTLMVKPVYWDLDANGKYVCKDLPFPEKDFTGRAPQYVTAIDISDDGKTIVGQVRDNSGFYTYSLIYTQDAEGKWSYKTLAEEKVFDRSKLDLLPELPEEPVRPLEEEFMTEADKQKYNEDLATYQDLYNQFMAGLLDRDELPPYPQKVDYISDKANQEAYANAIQDYETKSDEYWTAFYAFMEVMESHVVTGACYSYNSMSISRNGKYIAANLETPDPEGWSPEFSAPIFTPILFDVSGSEITYKEVKGLKSHRSTSVTEDGLMITCAPPVDYTRTSYVVKPGSTEPITFEQYYKEQKNEKVLGFLKENCVFDVTLYDWDEEGNLITSTVKDSLVVGSASINPDGTCIVSYMYDPFTNPEMARFTSYLLDTKQDAQASIEGVMKDEETEVIAREYYNLQGQRIAAPVSGVYLEKMITTNGVVTKKRIK